MEGMLGIHGSTGQVWSRNRHGASIQMIEGQEEHGWPVLPGVSLLCRKPGVWMA